MLDRAFLLTKKAFFSRESFEIGREKRIIKECDSFTDHSPQPRPYFANREAAGGETADRKRTV
jgi:hypothetical protein